MSRWKFIWHQLLPNMKTEWLKKDRIEPGSDDKECQSPGYLAGRNYFVFCLFCKKTLCCLDHISSHLVNRSLSSLSFWWISILEYTITFPSNHMKQVLMETNWARICKRLWSPGIDSKELIPAYVAWRNRFLFTKSGSEIAQGSLLVQQSVV